MLSLKPQNQWDGGLGDLHDLAKQRILLRIKPSRSDGGDGGRGISVRLGCRRGFDYGVGNGMDNRGKK